MSICYLTLPFAGKDQDRRREFSDDMELAAIVCAVSAERRRFRVTDYATDLLFLSKLCYPLWAIPWEKSCFLLDGMKSTADTILILKPPDPEAFVDNLKRNAKDQEQFFKTLRSEREAFTEFSSRKKVSIAGYIADREMLSDVMNFLKDATTIAGSSAPHSDFIQPKMDRENAIRTTDGILDHYNELQSQIKGLRYSTEMLTQETQVHASRLQQELQEATETFNQQIADLGKRVGEKTTQLENRRDLEIERVTTKNNRKADQMRADKQELEKQLLRLEQDKKEYEKRKDLRRSKKDKPGEVRWNVRLEHVKKQISKVNERVKSLANLIVKAQKETEKSTKELSDSYRKLIDEERMKVIDLEKSRDRKMEEKNKKISELQQDTLALKGNIKALIEQTELTSSRIEEATIAWETQTPTLIGIPLYLICHQVGNENRYLSVPPVIAQEYKGLVMRISTTLGVSGLGSRINSLLKPRSKNFERFFNSFGKELEKDEELQVTVNQVGVSSNLIAQADFGERLRNGIEELEDEGWVKPDEREAVLDAYRRG